MRQINNLVAIASCLITIIQPLSAIGRLKFFNHHPDLNRGLIVVIPALQEYKDFKGPCFLVMGHGYKNEFIVDGRDQNPSGDIYFFEHTQFNPDPETARKICNTGEYKKILQIPPKFFDTIFISPTDEDVEDFMMYF